MSTAPQTIALDRTQIVRAALELVDREGIERLSTRKLAATLGVKGPALYWHFKSMKELIAAMMREIVVPALAQVKPTDNWRDELAEAARVVREAMLGIRDGAKVVAAAAVDDAVREEIFGYLDAPLINAGISRDTADVVSAAVAGFVLGVASHDDSQESFRKEGRRESHDRTFTEGLDALLTGFEIKLGLQR